MLRFMRFHLSSKKLGVMRIRVVTPVIFFIHQIIEDLPQTVGIQELPPHKLKTSSVESNKNLEKNMKKQRERSNTSKLIFLSCAASKKTWSLIQKYSKLKPLPKSRNIFQGVAHNVLQAFGAFRRALNLFAGQTTHSCSLASIL